MTDHAEGTKNEGGTKKKRTLVRGLVWGPATIQRGPLFILADQECCPSSPRLPMPKRKSNPSDHVPNPPLPLSSLDAALDLLVCDTFTRLNSVAAKFEACAGVKLNDGVVKARWEEAVSRYWVIKSMDELTCGAKKIDVKDGTAETDYDVLEQNGVGGNQGKSALACIAASVEFTSLVAGKTDNNGRPLPASYPGAVAIHCLSPEEEHEWRKWTPKVGDIVLVDTLEDGLWPAKVCQKKAI